MFTFFFFNDTATTEIYTLSLHDALPISIQNWSTNVYNLVTKRAAAHEDAVMEWVDGNIGSKVKIGRSTRLNSSHANISYAVFCLKKKKNNNNHLNTQKLFITFRIYISLQ